MSSQQKTKVFFDAFPLVFDRPSGIGHLMVETIRALEANKEFADKHQLVLIAPRSGLKKLDRWGFKTTIHKAVPVKGRIWSALVLYRLLPPADLFFGKGVYVFSNYTTWPLLFSKSVTYIHDLNFVENPDTVSPKTYRVLSKNMKLWIKRTDHIVTISEFSKKEIKKIYDVADERISVVLCGVDDKKFYPLDTNIVESIKKKYEISGEYILFLSNIEPRKNIDRLLDAYAALPDNLHDSYSLLLVGGDGWRNESTLNKIEHLRSEGLRIIRPKHYVPDEHLPALISGATVLAHPALYEGFGLSPLQAMACGTPVIVSDTTSLPEVVGGSGLYIDPSSTEDIKSKMAQILTNKKQRQEYSKLGLERSKMFRWSYAANSLNDIFSRLLK